MGDLPRGAILIADRLRPSDVALIDPTRIAGVATDEGGAADHTSIMLSALGIPAVIATHGLSEAARDGHFVVIDGNAGTATLDPSRTTRAEARRGVALHASERQKLARLRRLPARLASGEPVELQSNLELPAELPLVVQSGATGIGLLRSEFLFIATDELPEEAAQATAYASIVKAMAGDVTTIRLLDWGGEKESAAMRRAGVGPRERETNPALGLRGLRLLLAHPELLETQFAAILASSLKGPIRVMLPMVTNIGEFRDAREAYERVGRRLRRRGTKLPVKLPPLGAMIETPGAALMADAFALEADFLSIGTNDLTMYALAVDRASSEVGSLYDPVHPAVLRLIAETTEAALRLRKPVSICGEIAGNPRLAPLLLGLGLRSFSMNASALPRVKQAIRAVSLDDCVRLARRVLDESDPVRIAALING
jgi:phosphotransferase system enzyme I (PtsI)